MHHKTKKNKRLTNNKEYQIQKKQLLIKQFCKKKKKQQIYRKNKLYQIESPKITYKTTKY